MDLREAGKSGINRHPWEIARAGCILSLIPRGQSGAAADIGAGDLYFSGLLGKKLGARIIAADINYKEYGNHGEIVLCREIEEIEAGSIGIMTLLDVLEHAEDDLGFLRRAVSRLKPAGRLIITVPAHQHLFSGHDVFLKHYRRYSRKGLLGLLSKTDLEVTELFHFFAVPYIARAFRIIFKKPGAAAGADNGLGNWPYSDRHFLTKLLVNALKADFAAERFLERAGITFPGLSLCAICTKRSA